MIREKDPCKLTETELIVEDVFDAKLALKVIEILLLHFGFLVLFVAESELAQVLEEGDLGHLFDSQSFCCKLVCIIWCKKQRLVGGKSLFKCTRHAVKR